VLSFYPFLYVALIAVLSEEDLMKSIRWMTIFTAVHLFLIGAVLSLPVTLFQQHKSYGTIVMGMYPNEIIKYFRLYQNDYSFATPSYADSALLEYHYRQHVAVFGGGSAHARHDDILTDFKVLAGKNIMIVRTSEPRKGEYAPYFAKVTVKPVSIKKATMYFVFGQGFNYPAYHGHFLVPIRDKFYRIPPYLPQKGNYFLERYFTIPEQDGV
jgi:hypothetical protein